MGRTVFIAPEHMKDNGPALARLETVFSDVVFAKVRARAIAEVAALGPEVDAVIVGMLDAIREPDLRTLTNLRVVGSTATGTDHLCVDAMRARGIEVVTSAGANGYAVGEHALMMILILLKQAFAAHQAVVTGVDRTGVYAWPSDLRGKRVGVVGAGKTAMALVRLVRAFECPVRVWTRRPDAHPEIAGLGATACDLEQLFETSDVVTLHVPLTDETRGMVTGDLVGRLPAGAVLVNVARTDVLDWPSVAPVLSARTDLRLGADAIGLRQRGIVDAMGDRCVFSPHVAGVTHGALRAMENAVVDGILRCFDSARSAAAPAGRV